MRFLINGIGGLVEVLGDEVDLPNCCGERFAVHHAVIPAISEVDDFALFAVSHVGTGFRVAGGASIDEAIEAARRKLLEKGERGLREALASIRRSRSDQRH